MRNSQTVEYSIIFKLPNELWSQIFTHCLPRHPSYNNDPAEEALRDPRLIPITLSSVSQAWRAIVIGSPELWSTCWVNYSHPEINTIWLGRAGRLKLRLYGKSYQCIPLDYNWEPLFQSILPFQLDWQSLDLYDMFQDDANQNLTEQVLSKLNLPALEVFKAPINGSRGISWVRQVLIHAPKIREFRVHALAHAMSHLGHLIQLAQLTTLDLGWCSPFVAVAAIPLLKQIQNVYMDIQDTPRVPISTPLLLNNNIVFMRLRGIFHSAYLFNSLTLPALRILHTQGSFDPESFINFVQRSGCRIKELSFECYEVSDTDIIRALKDSSVSRWIERVTLSETRYVPPNHNEYGITHKLLEFLRYSKDKQYLPHLTHLIFDGCALSKTRDGLLADMIISRFNRPLLCDCDECRIETEPRNALLEFVGVDTLDKGLSPLNIARLIPLPEKRQSNYEDRTTSLDLVLMDESRIPRRTFIWVSRPAAHTHCTTNDIL